MDRMLYIEINAEKRTELADALKTNHESILDKWVQQQRVQSVLTRKNISPVFFIKHFGSRVLDYFIGVINGENKPDDCPVIIAMMKFFSKHGLQLVDIYQICSGMKNSVIYILLEKGISYSDDKISTAIELFEANFSGVIREYQEFHIDPSLEIGSEIASKCSSYDSIILKEYFASDDDDGTAKILFRSDDVDNLLEYFSEVSERILLAFLHSDTSEVTAVSNIFSHVATILYHYSPYLDSLASGMSELSIALVNYKEAFMEALKSSESGILRLFDAVSTDMERYIERFSAENIAMRNAHHIHEPTTLSIRQIITMFAPDQIVAGDIEFF